MKLLKDTFLFNYLDQSVNVKDKMVGYQPTLDNLSLSSISDEMRTIEKRFNFPMKNRVVSDLNNGLVIPVLNKDRMTLPNSIPAYLYALNGRPVSVVNFTPYMSKGADDSVYGDARQMYALMQAGSILLGCRNKWTTITSSQEICNVGALCYSKLFVKVLDKLYAITLDPYRADKVRYIAAKFFLMNLLDKPNSTGLVKTAASVCKSMTLNNIEAFDSGLQDKDFENINTLMEMIAVQIDGCNSLNIRTFVRTWTQMYMPSTLLGMEYLPYFFHMLFAVSNGAHVNNEMIIDQLLGKDIDKLYVAVSNIIR